MNSRIARYAALCVLQVAALVALAAPARAADLASPMVLVATPALGASGYRETVLLAVPIGDGSHFGFILNRPTDTPLAELFPDDDASRRVSTRVHFGGPLMTDGPVRAGTRAGQIRPGAGRCDAATLRRAAGRCRRSRHRGPARRRAVLRRPGRLANAGSYAAELRAGAWHVVEPEADLVLGNDSGGLWKRLAPLAGGVRVNFSR